jgi:hypothetical protein
MRSAFDRDALVEEHSTDNAHDPRPVNAGPHADAPGCENSAARGENPSRFPHRHYMASVMQPPTAGESEVRAFPQPVAHDHAASGG